MTGLARVVDSRLDRDGFGLSAPVRDLIGHTLPVARHAAEPLRHIVTTDRLLPLTLRFVRFLNAQLIPRHGLYIALQKIIAVLLRGKGRSNAHIRAKHVDLLDQWHAGEFAVGINIGAAEQDQRGAVRRGVFRLGHEGVPGVVAVKLV